MATQVLRQVTGDPVAASEWLLAVTSALPLSQRVPSPLTLTVAHLVVTGQQDVCRLALKTAAAIALADPAQVATGNRMLKPHFIEVTVDHMQDPHSYITENYIKLNSRKHRTVILFWGEQ